MIYRRYAGLFFSLCVDITDNELAYLECIHLFVEILDHFFSNVCELDLVFNFHKVGCLCHHFSFIYLHTPFVYSYAFVFSYLVGITHRNSISHRSYIEGSCSENSGARVVYM